MTLFVSPASTPYNTFRERRTKELMAAATKAVQQRRRPALATLETANAVTGVFAWVGGPLKAGARCILAYNCRWACGRCV
jgi:hypothetical protein